MFKKLSKYWLKYSVGLSFICSIHCIATPIFILFFPFMRNLHEYNTYIEIMLLLSVLLLGGSSLLHDLKSHHKKVLPFALFMVGYVILLTGHLFFHDHNAHAAGGIDTSSIVIMIGSLLLFVGQMSGLYFRRTMPVTAVHAH